MPGENTKYVYLKRDISIEDSLSIFEKALSKLEFQRILVKDGVFEATDKALQYVKQHLHISAGDKLFDDNLAALGCQADKFPPLKSALMSHKKLLSAYRDQLTEIFTHKMFIYTARLGNIQKIVSMEKPVAFASREALEAFLIEHIPGEFALVPYIMVAVEPFANKLDAQDYMALESAKKKGDFQVVEDALIMCDNGQAIVNSHYAHIVTGNQASDYLQPVVGAKLITGDNGQAIVNSHYAHIVTGNQASDYLQPVVGAKQSIDHFGSAMTLFHRPTKLEKLQLARSVSQVIAVQEYESDSESHTHYQQIAHDHIQESLDQPAVSDHVYASINIFDKPQSATEKDHDRVSKPRITLL